MGGDLHDCIATRQVLETSIVLSASGHGGDAFPFYRILEGEAGHMARGRMDDQIATIATCVENG